MTFHAMMMLSTPRSIGSAALILFASLALAAAGCRPQEQITTYEVPKEIKARPVANTVPGEATDRMLAAVVPEGDKAWFFKIMGPIAAIDGRAAEIETFFASIRPAAGKPIPAWEIPGGWTQQGASGMRAATLLVPADGKPLELSVTSLPWTGSPAEMLSNVNRWRGQLDLAPVDQAGLADCTRTIKLGEVTATVVDLKGQVQASSMMPPFAGGAAIPARPNAAPPGASDASLPPGHPPIAAEPQAPVAASPLKFVTPSGWKELPATGMRKAAFGIEQGDKQALVTVIDFPIDAGPMMADPLENVNRWRREVGLAPIARDVLDANTKIVMVDGADARTVEAIPDAVQADQSQADRATIAAMVPHGKLMWFIKLTGSRELVAAERDNFQAFLESVKFPPTGGTTNGN